MKEVDKSSLNLSQASVDGRKNFLHTMEEFGALGIIWFYLGVGDLDKKAQRFFLSQMAPSISRGERRRLSLDAQELLGSYKIVDHTKIKIPKDDRPKLIVGNHWDKGPLHGRWPAYLIAKSIVDVLGSDVKNEIRWVMQDALELTIPIIKKRTGKVMPGTEYILDKIIKSYNLFKVNAPFKTENNHNNHNTQNVVREIAKDYNRGVPIGLYPEAQGTIILERGHWRSGFLATFLARKNPFGVVIPVGQWNEGSTLNLNFGDPFPISHLSKFRNKEGYQEVADYMMEKIASLMPEKYRGDYNR